MLHRWIKYYHCWFFESVALGGTALSKYDQYVSSFDLITIIYHNYMNTNKILYFINPDLLHLLRIRLIGTLLSEVRPRNPNLVGICYCGAL